MAKVQGVWITAFFFFLVSTIGILSGLVFASLLNEKLWNDYPLFIDANTIIDSFVTNPFERKLVIGLLIGLITGLMQWFFLRKHIFDSKWWILASIVGWALGFAISDFLTLFVADQNILGAIAGVTLGVVQWLILRRYAFKAHRWIVACTIGGFLVLGNIPANLATFYLWESPLFLLGVSVTMGGCMGLTLTWYSSSKE